jgi:hypothetical protein
MSKAAQAAATERLRYLRDVFADISSPRQLTDSMTELGCIYYELATVGLLPCDDVVRDLGINAVQYSRPHTSDVADHSYLSLAAYIVRYSTRQRLLLHPAPAAEVPQWQVTRSTQAAGQAEPVVTTESVPSSGSMMRTDFQNDYADQGKRFALFISELLAQLQTVDPPKPLTVDELEPEVTRIVVTYGKDEHGRHKHITAEQVANMIKESGKVTSKAQVQKTKAYTYYAEQGNKRRKPAATLTNTDNALEQLLGEDKRIQGSKGRRVKKPVTRSDD